MTISKGSKADFQKAIMENGFYPKEVPPCFQVKNFFDTAQKLNLLDPGSNLALGDLELARFNATKKGAQRRVFSCPNPIFFIRIAQFLGRHRHQISDHLRTKGKHYSLSIPTIDDVGHRPRAIRITSFEEFDKAKRRKLSVYPFLVKADTLRFYPSIYTHTLSWAYYGKEEAKKRRFDKNLIMNQLDKIVCSAQQGQTIGIPVGPDTSRIIAEILSVAVDEQFRNNLARPPNGVRLVDDIVFGAKNEAHARQILNAYRDALRFFELDINENKTQIIPNNQDLEPYWVFSIRRDLKSSIEINHVLDDAVRLAHKERNDSIINFTIRRLYEYGLFDKHWSDINPFLMRVAIGFPYSLPDIVDVISWQSSKLKKSEQQKWKKICHVIIGDHSRLGHDSEVVWAFWLLKHLDVKQKITKTLLTGVIKHSGPLPALMAIDLANGETELKEEAISLVRDRISARPMTEGDWLLSYEAKRLFDYPLKNLNRGDHSIFGEFINNDVQFYNPDLRLKTVDDEDGDDDESKISRRGIWQYDDKDESTDL